MPYLMGVLVPVMGAPIEVRVKLPRNNQTEVIKTVIGTQSDPVAAQCDIGVMFSSGGSDLNPLATSIYAECSGKASETFGPCFIVGEDEQGRMATLPKEAVQKVVLLYQHLTGNKPPGLSLRKPKKEQQGPKKARKAADFFRKQFYAQRVTELRDQKLKFDMASEAHNATVAWNQLTAEGKASYLAEEAADKARHDREMAEWIIKNPPKPSRPRTATYFYNQAHPDKENRPEFGTLAEEEKQVFEAKAQHDKQRYDEQLTKFQLHCESTGKNFAEEMKPKKRPSKALVASAAEKKTHKKAAEPARKGTKKQKTAEGQPKRVSGPLKKPKKAVVAHDEENEENEDNEEAADQAAADAGSDDE